MEQTLVDMKSGRALQDPHDEAFRIYSILRQAFEWSIFGLSALKTVSIQTADDLLHVCKTLPIADRLDLP